MGKRILSVIGGIVLALALMLCVPVMARAESATIYISTDSSTYNVDDTVEASIAIEASGEIMAYDLVISYDASVLDFVSGSGDAQGGGGNVYIKTSYSTTHSLTFKAKAIGNSNISVYSEVFWVGSDPQTSHNNPSTNVGVVPSHVASDNNYLSSLEVNANDLSPAFSPDVTSYTCSVGSNIDELVIASTAQDDSARIWITDTSLNYGDNSIAIVVTAENGAQRKYYINCSRSQAQETNPGQQQTQGNNQAQTEAQTQVQTQTQGQTQTQTQKQTVKVSINQPEAVLVIQPLEDGGAMPVGTSKHTIKIAGEDVEVAMVSKDSKYAYIYGLDEHGNKSWYRYLISDNSFQKYYPENTDNVILSEETKVNDKIVEAAGNGSDIWKIIAIAAIAVTCILLIVVGVGAAKRRSDEDSDFVDFEHDLELGDEDDEELITTPHENDGFVRPQAISNRKTEVRESETIKVEPIFVEPVKIDEEILEPEEVEMIETIDISEEIDLEEVQEDVKK